ncbi:MAG: response regulator [Verrucomicrobiales bacterium]|nr:response regulator [Verrucomicrobiales bacterium]
MRSQTRKPTLLVVDDEEGPRQSIRFVFRDEYNILMAENGPAALELARQHPIDAAVLDIRMSGMSGIDVLNRLKEMDPTIEVVMLTAYETLETARQALRLGACDYLNKPFDIATLRQAVGNAMERHAVAKEMRENNHRLRELQEDIQNQKVREELARKRGDIYASVIHDINGPLTIISGFVESINQRLGTAQTLEGEKLDIVKDRLNRITRQVTNCVQMSRRYLSFLHGSSETTSSVGVNQIFTDLEELLRAHPEASKNQLSIRPLAQEVAAEINGTDLIQILLNLAINAYQSSPQPLQVEIMGTLLTERLDLTRFEGTSGSGCRFIKDEGFQNRAPLVALSVRDTGSGISPEVLSRIFEPYFTTKSAGKGTGLGLSIVRRLIGEAKGCVAVETEIGQGTVFTVYLPARLSNQNTSPS